MAPGTREAWEQPGYGAAPVSDGPQLDGGEAPAQMMTYDALDKVQGF
jgi:hypothetical protein